MGNIESGLPIGQEVMADIASHSGEIVVVDFTSYIGPANSPIEEIRRRHVKEGRLIEARPFLAVEVQTSDSGRSTIPFIGSSTVIEKITARETEVVLYQNPLVDTVRLKSFDEIDGMRIAVFGEKVAKSMRSTLREILGA